MKTSLTQTTLRFVKPYLGVILLSLLVGIWCFSQVWTSLLSHQELPTIAHLHNIKSRLLKGEASQIQQIFPEGRFFCYILYGTTWVNVGLGSSNTSTQVEATTEATWAVTQLQQPEVADQFSQDTQVPHGIFYAGWLNRLRGGILKLEGSHPDPHLEEAFHQQATQIANAFKSSPVLFLSSYPNQAWPADNIAALGSLKIHDQLYGTSFTRDVITPWLTQLQYPIETQLLPHQVDATTGAALKPARGASSAYLLSLLPELDEELSQKLFQNYQREFVSNFFFVPLAREYPQTTATTRNHNSGPIFFGFGATASVATLAASHANHANFLAQRIFILHQKLGMNYRYLQQQQYLFGKFVIYDLFLSWGATQRSWVK